jgi:hypothetical protein
VSHLGTCLAVGDNLGVIWEVEIAAAGLSFTVLARGLLVRVVIGTGMDCARIRSSCNEGECPMTALAKVEPQLKHPE